MHPLTELMRCFRGRRRELTTSLKHIDEELCLDAYEQIGGEAVERNRTIVNKTHAAETADLEALRLKSLAQLPDSPGGRDITPDEATAIFRNVSRSAECDHDASELAKVDEV